MTLIEPKSSRVKLEIIKQDFNFVFMIGQLRK